MTKKKTLRQKMNENPWIAATLVLGVVCLIFFTSFYLEADKLPEPISIEESLCSLAQYVGTPLWVDINGNYEVGYNEFNEFANQSVDVVNQILIPNNIIFVYRLSCGRCQKQIEYFGDTWQDYIDSGFTIDCS